MGLFSKDVGIDLGTANTLVYMKGKGIIMREPSVVAVDTKTDEVRCVGAEAKAVIRRTPGSIGAVRPLKDGVIADFAKKLNGKFEIKGGFMDGKVVDMATVNALAAIPALPVLQAQVLGTMLAPISGLACVLKQIAEKNGAPAEEASAE